MASDISSYYRKLRRAGWTVEHHGKHVRITPPTGGAEWWGPSTPSCHRALLNLRTDLRKRCGVEPPPV